MDYLPINIDLRGKPVLVLGGGTVATRKINMLLKASAQITCISLDFKPEIHQLSQTTGLNLIQTDLVSESTHYLNQSFLGSFQLVLTATDNGFIAKRVYQICQDNNILVNTVDSKALCNYITPAIVDRSPIVVAITSSGTAPVLARNIRQKIEKILPSNLGKLAIKANSMRHAVIQKISSFTVRKHFWERFFSSHYAQDILHNRTTLDNSSLINKLSKPEHYQGEVALVGAGPGDPELLTIKALRTIQEADVVFHDRLVTAEILELVRRDAELIPVGKSQGHHSVPQSQINELLIKHAQQGQKVVRLKGGDPFVFGRGGEELQAIKKCGIKFSIVPGITAAVGCSAYAGIPLTHRDFAQNVLFVTAHCKNSIDTLDWVSLAREKQTIAVYMGLMKSEILSAKLIAHGKDSKTPVAIIENGTTNKQRVVRGQLSQLKSLINEHQIQSPALIIIGEVAALNDDLAWFKNHEHNLESTRTMKIA